MAKSSPSNLILLAEDQETEIALMQRAFKKAQIASSLQVVRDGEQVLAYLKGEGSYSERADYGLPDLLLLDLSMPRMGGFEVLQWIREQPGLKNLRVVVLTASENRQDMDRAYELGANSYLVKPADFHRFVEMITTVHAYWIEAILRPQLSRSSLSGVGSQPSADELISG